MEDWDPEEDAAMEAFREAEAQSEGTIFQSKPHLPQTNHFLFHQRNSMNLNSDSSQIEGMSSRFAAEFSSMPSSLHSPLKNNTQQSKRNNVEKNSGSGDYEDQCALDTDSASNYAKKRRIVGSLADDADLLDDEELVENQSLNQSSRASFRKPMGISFEDEDEEDIEHLIQHTQKKEDFESYLIGETEKHDDAAEKSLSFSSQKRRGNINISFEDEDILEDLSVDKQQRPFSPKNMDYDFSVQSLTEAIPSSSKDVPLRDFYHSHSKEEERNSFPNLSAGRGSSLTNKSTFHSLTHDFSEIPINSFGFVKAISSDGTYLYFPKKKTSALTPLGNSSGPLLSDRISKLMDIVREKIKFNETITRNAAELEMENDKDEYLFETPIEKKLWVDKYAPKLYVDLVGDETVNRSVLSWVKSWDFCVFGKDAKHTIPNQIDRKRSKFNPSMVIDGKKRPERKILLLSGPPGLGKTTLAHVIGRHAGYHIVEVNASMERSGKSFSSVVISAIEAQPSFLGNPNLVIIDEIDGVSSAGGENASFISQLVQLAKGRDTTNAKFANKKKERKGQKKIKELLRPIICICNDPYVPALRELLQVSFHIAIKPPGFQILANRLHQICKWEGMDATLQSMMSLCELSQGDLRSAINTLQFLKRKTKNVTQKDVEKLTVGNKDISYGWSKVCQAIFEKAKSKRTALEKERFKKSDASDDYISRISQLVHGYGDYDFIMQACFENYLNTKLFDVTSKESNVESRFAQQSDQIIFFDALQKKVQSEQAFELQSYLVFPIASFHRLFATTRQASLDFPSAFFQVDTAKKQIKSLISSFWHGFNPSLKSMWFNKSDIVLELTPLLIYIISPSFKPINIQVLKPNERKILDNLVQTLVAFGLTMSKHTTEKNMVEFCLEPPINVLVDLYPFCNMRRTISDLSYSSNQLIAHECELFKLKLAAGITVSKNDSLKNDSKRILNNEERKGQNTPLNLLADRTIQLEDLIPTAIANVSEKPLKDFFGRVIIKKEKENCSNQSAGKSLDLQDRTISGRTLAKSIVSYKFNEGYSNAVRKPLFISDIL